MTDDERRGRTTPRERIEPSDPDTATVAAWLDELGRLPLGPRGTVAALVETPRPHEHERRESVTVEAGKGFAGDHGRKSFYLGKYVPGREVSAIALDTLRVLGVDPVVVGDNLITEGFDLGALEPGDRVRVGGTVVLARSPRAHRPCTVFRERTSPEAYAVVREQRHRGALFVVEAGGPVRVGDVIERIAG
jgi:MOSC domain-containing protein YiiM